MDVPLKRRLRWPWHWIAVAVVALALAAWAARLVVPGRLEVPLAELRLATAEISQFHDDVVVRAQAAPLTAIMLDSTESGRVDEVLARDGGEVKRGELLFRLSNPQRHLDMLARQSNGPNKYRICRICGWHWKAAGPNISAASRS